MATKARFRWPGINDLGNGGLRRLNEAGRNLENVIGGHLGPRGDAYVVAQEFGAAGDGAHDDLGAIQTAVDTMSAAGGGIVYLPPLNVAAGRFYRVRTPISMPDNVTLEGAGPDSLIFNDRTDGPNVATQPAIHIGWFIENYWSELTELYPLNDISQGASVVTFDTPGDEDNFEVGDLIAIRTAAETQGSEPVHVEVSEVVAVGSGTITLQDPVSEDMVGPTIWNATQHQPLAPPNGGVQLPIRLARRVTVRNIAVASNQFWIARVGGYRCTVRDLEVIHGGDLFNANVWTRSLVENVRGTWFGGMLETVAAIHSTFRGLRGSFYDLPAQQGNTGPGISIGGTTKNCLVEDFELECGDYDGNIRALRILGANNTVRRGKIVSQQARALEFGTTSDADNFNRDNTVQDVEFRMNAPVFFIDAGASGTPAFDVVRPRVIDCRFYGTPSGNAVTHGRCIDGRFEGNHIEQGDIAFQTEASGSRWINNHVTGDFTGPGLGSQIIYNNVDDRSELIAQIQQTSTVNAINSTTVNNVIGSVPIPANAFNDAEWLDLRLEAEIGAISTNGTKDLRLRLFDDDTATLLSVLATLSLDAADTGEASFIGRLYASNADRLDSYIEHSQAGTRTVLVRNVVGLDLANTNYRIDVEAWVGNAADTILVMGFTFRPFRPHYTGAY